MKQAQLPPSNAASIFTQHFAACTLRIEKLAFSVEKNKTLFPLNSHTDQLLSDEQEESIDALILRYSQCVSIIQDHLFRGIAHLELEDISDKSNRDKALLMEKLGAIKSANDFGTAALLRNKFAHHYPEIHAQRIERLNLILEEAVFVINTFSSLKAFVQRKHYLDMQT